jgi:uncharacterized Zn finger protein
MFYDDFNVYPKSRPRAAKGGIKARSKRGAFVENWWSKRWITVLESYNLGARLTRGRRYARQGQVLSIEVDCGKVTASVQGSRSRPYQVEIILKPFSKTEWEKVVSCLASQPVFMAGLLAGEMPDDIEDIFEDAGLSLFPEEMIDLETDCSCPDWSNPCKHIAAVYYLLGEEFDRNPFLIFKLRGLDRDELMTMLDGAASPEDFLEDEWEMSMAAGCAGELVLPMDPKAFWEGGQSPEEFLTADIAPGAFSALLKQLGEFPFWQGEESLLAVLEPIYEGVFKTGTKLYTGEEGED